jgi:hypothetical protein
MLFRQCKIELLPLTSRCRSAPFMYIDTEERGQFILDFNA